MKTEHFCATCFTSINKYINVNDENYSILVPFNMLHNSIATTPIFNHHYAGVPSLTRLPFTNYVSWLISTNSYINCCFRIKFHYFINRTATNASYHKRRCCFCYTYIHIRSELLRIQSLKQSCCTSLG